MIKIAFVIDTIDTPGAGTEKQLLLLLKHLDRSKFQPHLICLHDSDWLRGRSFDIPVVKYRAFSVTNRHYWLEVRNLAAYLRREKIDIVQTHFVDGTIFGTMAAHRAKVPVLISTRRNIGNWHNWLYIRLFRFLRRWTTVYLGNSQAALDRTIAIERVRPERTHLIYNALDLAAFSCINPTLRQEKRRAWGLADDDVVIGIIANLREVKNIESLVDATARLVDDFPKLKVVSVGEGEWRPHIEERIRTHKLEERFLLMGRDTDNLACLAAFDIGTLVSTAESFSNSLIEYMAAGLPIVASNVGGNAEAITSEDIGLLYPVENIKALEQALRRLLTDPPLARRLGVNAREAAHSRFSLEACIRAHEAYYERLTEQKGQQADRSSAPIAGR